MSIASEVMPSVPLAPAVSRPAGVRLAYLISHYPATSHTFILNEIRGLRELGFDIVTASINACDRPVAELEEAEQSESGATFYVKQAGIRFAAQALFSALMTQPVGFLRGLYFTILLGGAPIRFFYFIEALMVGAWMRRQKRSHLHVHFGGPASSVAMILAHTFPYTMSLTIHGPDEFYDVRKYYLAQKIETASFVCCISSFARSQLMFLSPSSMWDKLLVSRLGVDLARFSTSKPANASHTIEIVCVGRLVAAKGQRILIAAVRRLLEQAYDVRLRLVGDGADRANVEAAVAANGMADRVVFEGAVGVTRVRQILGNADIFALPSFAEGIPVALMEAMAMEIPCVSTAITGVPELIRNEVDGLLVAPSDDAQLATALARLIDDPGLRRQLGRSGRLQVQEKYDLHRSVQVLGEIFQCRL